MGIKEQTRSKLKLIAMPYQGKIKRKVVTQKEDIILLKICVSHLPCLKKLRSSSYKGLFWKNVSLDFNNQTNSSRPVRQIRNRFKSMHEYYLKMKNTAFLESKLHEAKYITEEVVFFQTLSQCFTQMYYDDKGVLNSRMQEHNEDLNEEMTLCSSPDELSMLAMDECHYGEHNPTFSYEVTTKPQNEANYDMVDLIYSKVVQDDPLDVGDFFFTSTILSTPIQNVIAKSSHHE